MGQFGSRGGLRKVVPLKPGAVVNWIDLNAEPYAPKRENNPKGYAVQSEAMQEYKMKNEKNQE